LEDKYPDHGSTIVAKKLIKMVSIKVEQYKGRPTYVKFMELVDNDLITF